MVFASDILAGRSGQTSALVELIQSFAHARAQRRDYLNTVDQLSVLSDAALDDLGIARADIPAMARKTVYGLHK